MLLLLPFWILAAFLISVPSGSSLDDVCLNNWSIGPGEASIRNCDILSGRTDLISRCGVVRGNENVTVEWHFSSSAEEAGKNGNILTTSMDQHFSVNMICMPTVCIAELTIHNVNISDVGYYWCKMAEPRESIVGIRNPSSILNVSRSCDELYPCTESSIETFSLNNIWCAYGEVTVNTATIVHLQNQSECEGGDTFATSNGIETTTIAVTSDPIIAISSDNPTTTTATETLLPGRPTNETATEPSDTQQTSDAPAVTDVTSDQMLATTEDTRQTGPPSNSNTAPELTPTVITPTSATEGPSEGANHTTSEMDKSTSSALHVVWPIVGVGISILLLIIAILLGLIVFLHCIKRKTKNNNVACVNRGFMVEEVELVNIRPTELKIENDISGDQLYDEIPSNFTLTASNNEHSPSLPPVTHNVSAKTILCPGRYEDVDLDSMNQNNAADSKNLYKTMPNNSYGESNSFLHSESWSHDQSSSNSFSRPPGSPLELAIFDNPKYSSNPVKKQINIYGCESSDSNFNSGGPKQQWLARTSQKSFAEGHKEHYQESSQFSGSDVFEDESKLPMSPTGVTPASHYAHVLPSASKESTYALPIKSTGDKYISEHGHIYMILEGATAPDAGKEKAPAPPPTYSRVTPKRDRANNKLLQIEESDSLHDNIAAYCSPPDTDSSVSGSDYDAIGREHPKAMRRASTSDDSGYDVIERGEMKFSPKSAGVDARYDVMDRQRAPREQSSSPQDKYSNYDVMERTTIPSNSKTHKMTVPSKQTHPPAYSLLELSGDREEKCTTNANSPFYDALKLETSRDKQEACQDKRTQAFYHTVDPEAQNILTIP